LGAVGSQGEVALAGQAGFERVGRVIESGVQHTTVAATGVSSVAILFFEYDNRCIRVLSPQFASNADPDDSRADDEKISCLLLHLASIAQRFKAAV